MSAGMADRPEFVRHILAMPLVLLLAACVLPRDEGRRFRAHLQEVVGRPVHVLLDDLGPAAAEVDEAGRHYEWGVLVIFYEGEGRVGGDRNCTVEAVADSGDIVRTARMKGYDYGCGEMLLDLRRRAARYRKDPGLRQREEEEMQRLSNRLVRLRREFNEHARH
jgi:hypothetical protein